MFEQMLGSFLDSPQGQAAQRALEERGVPQGQIQQILSAALPAAASSLQQQGEKQMPGAPAVGAFDALGGHPAQSFLVAAATAMLRGEGIGSAVRNGAMGMIGGRIGEALASRLGIDPQMANGLAAALTPFITSFAHERLADHPHVVAQRGTTPAGQEKFEANLAAKRAMGIDAMPEGAMGGRGWGKPQGGYGYGNGAHPRK